MRGAGWHVCNTMANVCPTSWHFCCGSKAGWGNVATLVRRSKPNLIVRGSSFRGMRIMKMRKKTLVLQLAQVIGAGAFIAASPLVMAQQGAPVGTEGLGLSPAPDVQKLERVTVTGSSIRATRPRAPFRC